MTISHHFVEPLDVLFLRGNKLFGDPGSHGESLVPPWPSVAAGALRSRLLVADGADLSAFAAGRIEHPSLGTPQAPGVFRLTGFDLARRTAGGTFETLHALPADLVAERTDPDGTLQLRRLQPVSPADGILSSAPLSRWPVMPQTARAKAIGGLWLNQAGWSDYLAGRTPRPDALVPGSDLWKLDARVGVGIDQAARRAADGKLFTVQAVAFAPDMGFLAGVEGAELPSPSLLRLGGDGRAARSEAVQYRPAGIDLAGIVRARRARVVLTTPGEFENGWFPDGIAADRSVKWTGATARLVCAAVPRADVVSGWDLAHRQPKTARRVAPPGSVYWLDDIDATVESLAALVYDGLWHGGSRNPVRRAEGFNRFSLAVW